MDRQTLLPNPSTPAEENENHTTSEIQHSSYSTRQMPLPGSSGPDEPSAGRNAPFQTP